MSEKEDTSSRKFAKKLGSSVAVVTTNFADNSKRLKNVASADASESSFSYDFKVNSYNYQCELDTAASDIFLSLCAAKQIGLKITPSKQRVTLGDVSVVSTVGTAKATIKVGSEYSKEEIVIPTGDVDTEVLTMGRS